MHLRFTEPSVGTSQFFRPELMADHYDPPGVSVWEDADGVRHFQVVKEVGEVLLEEDGVDHYDDADTDTDSE